MVGTDGLESGFEVGCSERALGLVEEGGDEGVKKPIGQFDGVCFVADDGEDHVGVNFVVDAEGSVVYLFQGGLLSFAVGGHFRVMLFDFVAHLEQLFIGVEVAGLAEDEAVAGAGWVRGGVLMITDFIIF